MIVADLKKKQKEKAEQRTLEILRLNISKK